MELNSQSVDDWRTCLTLTRRTTLFRCILCIQLGLVKQPRNLPRERNSGCSMASAAFSATRSESGAYSVDECTVLGIFSLEQTAADQQARICSHRLRLCSEPHRSEIGNVRLFSHRGGFVFLLTCWLSLDATFMLYAGWRRVDYDFCIDTSTYVRRT